MTVFKYFDKTTLIRAARLAIRRGYNRQLDVKAIIDKMPDDQLTPVSYSMIHEHAAGVRVAPHVRAVLIVNADGDTALLDVDLDVFNKLPEWEVDMDEVRAEAKAKAAS